MSTFRDRDTDRKRTNRSVLERSDRCEAIVQSTVEAFIAVDEDGRILLFNDAAERMFGCSEQEVIGSRLDEFVEPRFHSELAAGFERAREADRDAPSHSMATTLRGVRTNGQ